MPTLPPPFAAVERDLPDGIDAAVEGAVPPWLDGRLLRVGPALLETATWAAAHLFDGLGLVQGWQLAAGRVRLQTRFLDSRAWHDAHQGRAELASFATPTRRSLLRRLLAPIPETTDNCNVNIVPWGDGAAALSEVPTQLLVDPETLQVTGRVHYTDQGLAGHAMLAHPLWDHDRGAAVNLAIHYGRASRLSIFRVDPADGRRVVEGALDVDAVPYHHSFGLTRRHAVLVHHPYAVHPARMLMSNAPFASHLRWDSQAPTTLAVLDRAAGTWRRAEAPTSFVFHVANCFEEGEDLVVDLCVYDDPDVVDRLSVARLSAGEQPGVGRLERWRLGRGRDRVEVETPADIAGLEFPRLHARRDQGRPYRWLYGVGGQLDALVRVDLAEGSSRTFTRDGFAFAEPVFVPSPAAAAANDGVVVATALSTTTIEQSALVVLDAATWALLAWCPVPLRLPVSFHGSWLPARPGSPAG